MTLVVGTAGHIDHGKTTLLRGLTGIDADRLPEERRRGMTIDVGYAHLDLGDGATIDFVDVPGHDRLVGNMLVGAGEVDVPMLVVAADDGPRAQTLEHLALLDALRLPPGLAVVTKADMVPPERIHEVLAEVEDLLATTSLAGSPVLAASGRTGQGLDDVRATLAALQARVRPPARPPTLAIDRAFAVRGRGAVVTGTLRGGPLAVGDMLRLVPGDRSVRVREVQVHGRTVEAVAAGGRTALNLAGVAVDELPRGSVLTADPDVEPTDRILAAFETPIADRTRGRLHVGTAAMDASVGRSGRDALTLPDGRVAGTVRLSRSLGLAPGDRFVLRPGPGRPPVGGSVLDVAPPRGVSRRRQTPERVATLAERVGNRAPSHQVSEHAAAADARPPDDDRAARRDLHGATPDATGRIVLAEDVRTRAERAARDTVGKGTASLGAVRASAARSLRLDVTLRRDEAARAAEDLVDALVRNGTLVRENEVLRSPTTAAPAPDPALEAAMDRLEVALATPAPPPLHAAARAAGCPPTGIRELERRSRIVVLEPDLAYAMRTYLELTGRALAMAAAAPLTPAAFRDRTGTSRKYVMAMLEDLDRRAILRRTPAGHVPGPRAPRAADARDAPDAGDAPTTAAGPTG